MINEMQSVQNFKHHLLALNRIELQDFFHQSARDSVDFCENILVPALEEIGSEWEDNQLSLSQVFMAGKLSEEFLKQILIDTKQTHRSQPNIAIVLLEDTHPLGKRIVCSVLRASGLIIHDYGPLTVEQVVSRIHEEQIDILLISTLMLSSALRVKALKELIDKNGLKTRLVVGGAPFRLDPNLWKHVGADATSVTASGALDAVRQLSKEQL